MKAIAAMSRNRVIGRRGGLPWHLPEESRWFKETTMGHVVLMGRRTFEGLPGGRPLPGRLNLVATRRGAFQLPSGSGEVELVRELAAFRPEVYQTGAREVFVAGGEEIYRMMLPRCAELLLTVVDQDVSGGDAFFPTFEDAFRFAGVIRRGERFEVRRYESAS